VKVKHLENLMKKRGFFDSRAMGRHGPVKLAVLTGRHGMEKRPGGRALGWRRGTSTATARHGPPGRHGPMAIYRCDCVTVAHIFYKKNKKNNYRLQWSGLYICSPN
jgi:hypothetical protein